MIESEYIKKTDAMNIVKRTHGDYVAAWSEIRELPAVEIAKEKKLVASWKWDGNSWVCGNCKYPSVVAPAEDDGEDDDSPQTFVAKESAVVIAAVLPSQIASCKIVHNKTPFSFALCHPTAVCDGRSQTSAVFVKSAKLRSV